MKVIWALVGTILYSFWTFTAQAQVFVYPRRAEQSQVRYFNPDWKKIRLSFKTDFGEVPVDLYFYESERLSAEIAAPMIESSVRMLARQFKYVPKRPIPYFLYNSYLEFLETNLFPVQVGTLGVTSPEDFKLALAFFGDYDLFERVSTHELVHEFMSQKLADLTQGTSEGLKLLPLWFVEGMAEYYTMNGMDVETEIMVRDFLTHPNAYEGYVETGFFSEGPYSFFGIYKYGQARCAFLEETFGAGVIQTILEKAHDPQNKDFKGLLQKITKLTPEELSRKFESWVKTRSYPAYVSARQHASDFKIIDSAKGNPQFLSSSPSGRYVGYLTAMPDSGQMRIYLFHSVHPNRVTEVTSDGRPGVEALHMTSGQNFDVSENGLVYVAQSRGHDVLYWQEFEDRGDGRISLKGVTRYEPGSQGILAVESPAISPDQKRIAFVGYSKDGRKDIFLLTRKEGSSFDLQRLTHDLFAERAIDWGPKGIVFTSDAQTKGIFNLFLLSPDSQEPATAPTQEPTALTQIQENVLQPAMMPDGRILFVTYRNKRANIFEVHDGRIIQRTDVDTALSQPGSGVDGLWTLLYHSGKKKPTFIPNSKLLRETPEFQTQIRTPVSLTRTALTAAEDYKVWTLKNWEFGRTIGFFGAGPGGASGQLVTSVHDKLRNHIVAVNLLFLGPWSLTDGHMIYINQQNRTIWGVGPFREIRVRAFQTLNQEMRYTTFESYTGMLGSLRYPFSRFLYVQGNLSLGELDPFLPSEQERFLRDVQTSTGTNLYEDWLSQERGPEFLVQSSLSLGYNSMRYHQFTGPVSGSSALIQVEGDSFTKTGEFGSRLRVDLERFYALAPPVNFLVRAAGGTTLKATHAHDFYLSALYALRPVPSSDMDRLLGRHFFFSTAELQFPLRSILKLLFFEPEGIAGFDFGGVSQSPEQLWNHRVLGLVTGLNFNFMPLVFRLHFAKPIAAGSGGLPNRGEWITHFALTYMYD